MLVHPSSMYIYFYGHACPSLPEKFNTFMALELESFYNNGGLISFLGWTGGREICAVLRPNAGDGDVVRHGAGLRGGGAVHDAGAEGDVSAFPVHKGRDNGADEGDV